MKNFNGDRLMKPREAANYLNVHVNTLGRYRKENSGPPYLTIEGVIRYDRAKLDEYLESKGVKP